MSRSAGVGAKIGRDGLRWAAITGFILIWSVATPLFAGPDEPTHAIRIAALVRGELVGDAVPGQPRALTRVNVPEMYPNGISVACWNNFPDRTPRCAEKPTSHRIVPAWTFAGRYPPMYYLLVALPAVFTSSAGTIYAMRAVSAALSALMLLLALKGTRELLRPGIAVVGLAAAVTPMCVFMASVVNPNGLEITAAIATWATAIVMLSEARAPTSAAAWRFTVAASVVALSRGASVIWLVVIVGLAAMAFGSRSAITRWRTVVTWPQVAVLSASLVAALAWVATVGGLSMVPAGGADASASWADMFRVSLGRVEQDILREMVGVLQWREVSVPAAVYVFWIILVGSLLVTAFGVAGGRTRAAFVVLLLGGFLGPVAIETLHGELGSFWQGRYSLPVMVGIPLLAGATLAGAGKAVSLPTRHLLVGVAVGHLATLFWVLHRNTVGISGPLWFFGHEKWSPPVPSVVLLLGTVAAMAAIARLWAGSTSSAALGENERAGAMGLLNAPDDRPA